MPKHKIVETSVEAFHSLNPEQLVGLRKKILNTLIAIGSGHYEDIAMAANITSSQCWKRLSELEKFKMIHRTGERKMLSSKRMGFVWAPGASPEPVQKKERVMKGKTVSQFAKAILNQPERLF